MFRNSLGKYFVNIHYPGLGTAVGNKGAQREDTEPDLVLGAQ